MVTLGALQGLSRQQLEADYLALQEDAQRADAAWARADRDRIDSEGRWRDLRAALELAAMTCVIDGATPDVLARAAQIATTLKAMAALEVADASRQT